MWRSFLTAVIAAALYLPGLPGHAADPPPTAPGDPALRSVLVVDLAQRVADVGRDHADKSDVSQLLYLSAAASVHLHVLGYEQTAPLHIHRATEEATVIVTGTPRLTLVFARDGKRETRNVAAGPGKTIFSPPFTGHEWFNPDPKGMQANLMFASPPFDGNFYLKPADRRLLKGTEPLIWDPDDSLRAFLASGQASAIEKRPMRGDKLVEVLVRDELSIPAHPVSPTLFYVLRGEGALLLDKEYPARERLLVEVPAGLPIKVRAKPGAPLVMLAFRPET